jgi:hypothetical protein
MILTIPLIVHQSLHVSASLSSAAIDSSHTDLFVVPFATTVAHITPLLSDQVSLNIIWVYTLRS